MPCRWLQESPLALRRCADSSCGRGYLKSWFGAESRLRGCRNFFVGLAVDGKSLPTLALENGAPGAAFLFGA